jgi:hypothetical protein
MGGRGDGLHARQRPADRGRRAGPSCSATTC